MQMGLESQTDWESDHICLLIFDGLFVVYLVVQGSSVMIIIYKFPNRKLEWFRSTNKLNLKGEHSNWMLPMGMVPMIKIPHMNVISTLYVLNIVQCKKNKNHGI